MSSENVHLLYMCGARRRGEQGGHTWCGIGLGRARWRGVEGASWSLGVGAPQRLTDLDLIFKPTRANFPICFWLPESRPNLVNHASICILSTLGKSICILAITHAVSRKNRNTSLYRGFDGGTYLAKAILRGPLAGGRILR